jgi:hypothetical protein
VVDSGISNVRGIINPTREFENAISITGKMVVKSSTDGMNKSNGGTPVMWEDW